MGAWDLIKKRTASDGAVWRSHDGACYMRTGGTAVREEAEFQRFLADHGYPVPRPTEIGSDGEGWFFIEPSAGPASLHDRAVAEADETGTVPDRLVDAAVDVSARLLRSQAALVQPATPHELKAWFDRAALPAHVFAENPDLDTRRTRAVMDQALRRLSEVPVCHSHLDYGLPNAFPDQVIDWQHHALAPLGYDVYPMLDITAFKGGGKGYCFSPEQRAYYITGLDEVGSDFVGYRPSRYLGDFLLAKSFFFLALMRPEDQRAPRPDKHRKWQYRRRLFQMGIEQYDSSRTIDTGTFPTLASFSDSAGRPTDPGPRLPR